MTCPSHQEVEMNHLLSKPFFPLSTLLSLILIAGCCPYIPGLMPTAYPTYTPFPTWTPMGSGLVAPATAGAGSEAEQLNQAGTTGRIAYTSVKGGSYNIWVINADGTGEEKITDAVNSEEFQGALHAWWSPDGKQMVFQCNYHSAHENICTMNSDGSQIKRLTDGRNFDPAWSPDGKYIVYYSQDGPEEDIMVMKADGSGIKNLTQHASSNVNPVWSPDSRQIAFISDRDKNDSMFWNLYIMNLNGSGLTRLTNDQWTNATTLAWSPDGKQVAFSSYRARDDGASEIYVMNIDGSGVTRLTNSPYADMLASWSPDGTRLAFVTERHPPKVELYVMNADGSGQTRLVTIEGTSTEVDPVWAPE
jgi:Tol biopolymer transport system component